MSVALVSAEHRIALAAVAVLAAAAAWILARGLRRQSPAIACAGVAAAAAVALAADLATLGVTRGALAEGAPYDEHELSRTSPWGPLGLAVGFVAAAAALGLAALAGRRIASPWRRASLLGLRAGAVLAALVLFVEPAIELRDVARAPNHVAIVVDDSRSMALREDRDGRSRMERAAAILEGSGDALEAWRQRHEIDAFRFSEDLERAPVGAVAEAEPTGEHTRFRRALEGLRDAYDDRDLAGVVLLSDGIATDELRGGTERGGAEQILRELEAPVHTVWTGRPGLADVAITDVRVDELAFVRTVVPIEVVVRTTGFEEERRVPITLREEGEPLRRKWIDLPAGEGEKRIRFEFAPSEIGTFAYEVSTPVADEEAVAENNRRSFVLRVVRDQIRVLQVAGQPSWDVRALRTMLKDNPNVDLISFFILRTQDDVTMVPDDELSLIPFPTRELFEDELPSFDVVAMQNFDFAPYRMGRYLDNIRDYVAGGGALVMLGGELSFASGHYRGTPVGEALPVELPVRGDPDALLDEEPFSPALTDAGASHPVTSLRRDPGDNREAWRELPELEGVNRVTGAREDATILAEHPNLTGAGGEPMPVVAVGEHGDGRTLAVTTDSLWRWDFVAAGEPGVERRYGDFWRNAIRWLIRDPEFEYLRVASGRREYAPGEGAAIEATLRGRDYAPQEGADIDLTVEREGFGGEDEVVFEGELTTDEAGGAALPLEDLGPGLYAVDAAAEAAGERHEAAHRFLVGSTPRELERPAAEADLLAEIAHRTGGAFLPEADALPRDLDFEEPRVVRVDRRTEVELWSRPTLFFLALLFLGLEWALRQKRATM